MTKARLLQLTFALGLLGLLFAGLDGGAAILLLARAEPAWLILGVAALTAQTLLSAMRWQFTANRLGQGLTFGRAVREYYLGQVVNQSLPGGVLGDAGRAYRARHQGGLRRAGTAVMVERTLGQFALFAIMGLGLLLNKGEDPPLAVIGLVGTIFAVVVVAMVLAPMIPTIAGYLALARPAVTGRGALPIQLGLNLSIAGLNILAFASCAHATGTPMTAAQAALYVPLILLTMVIPVTISGWGIREGAAAAFFPLVGASASAGLAASTAFGLLFLLSTLPGLLVPVLRGNATAPYRERKLTVDP